MELINCKASARLLMLVTVFLGGFAGLAQANDAWPVSVARTGFSEQQANQVLANHAPFKIAAAGNQALYSYLNMPAFFPHHTVARQGPIRPLADARTAAALGALRVSTSLGELSLDELLADKRSRLQGFLVLHKGQVVYEKYPGMQPQDSHLWWSVAKILAGVLTELLIDEGRIEPEQNIIHYLPEFAGSGWDGASVNNVLHMASGIAAVDSAQGYADPNSEIGRLIYAEGVLKRAGHAPLGHDESLSMMSSAHKPGTKYAYSSANTNMLGLLIERVTGARYADVLQQRIWSKIGAEGDGMLGLSPDGRPIAHGMYSSRLRDMARLGLLFTPSGYRDDLLPARVLSRIGDTSQTQHYRNAPESADWAKGRLGEAPVSALSQWDGLFADGDLFKSGYDGQALYVSPSRDVVIAMFATSKDKSAYAYLRPLAQQFAPQTSAPTYRRYISPKFR